MIRLRPSGADEVLIKRVRDWYEPGPGVFIAPQALFNPAILFTTGVNGTWYDPSDLNTLFQDAAGTTPVTAVEQPVGLMLDKSKGLVLGPELVTNGDFSSGTAGWAAYSGVAGGVISNPGGYLLVSNNGGTYARGASTLFGLTVGKIYKVTGSCLYSSNGAVVRITTAPDAASGYVYNNTALTVGVISFVFTATATTMYIAVGIESTVGTATASFDNISVRELPGNHAFNSSGNSANFPVLSARYNLLTKTEDFSDAAWVKTGSTATSSSVTATATFASAYQTVAVSPSAQYTQVAEVQFGSGATQIFSLLSESGTSYTASFNLQSGTVVAQSNCTATIAALGGGYYRLSATFTNAAGVTSLTPKYWIGLYTGTNNSGTVFNIRNADFRAANDALNQPAYQRVNTSTDYDTVGFKPYLKFNGTNQWLQTNSIDFSYGDKMFVCAGVRKLNDALTGVVSELNTSFGVNTFTLGAPTLVPDYRYRFGSGGSATTSVVNDPGLYSAPITNVLSGIGNISAPSATLRVNGAQVAQSTASQGTGNYGNYPLYIGARAGSSLWFNGRLHQLIVAGKQASDSEIGQTEAFTNQKTGAY